MKNCPTKTIGTYIKLFVLLILFLDPFLKASAQYFGRNKVQYQNFDFKNLKTPHFNIYHYPETDTTILFIGELSEAWYKNFSKLFDYEFKTRNPLIIYRNASHFHQTKIIPQLIGIGTGGVTEGYKNRVVLPLADSWENTNHVLGHEIVHAFQYRLLKSDDSLGLQSISNLPLWMVEGLAEYLSIGSFDTHTAMWMSDAVLHDDIPTIKQLTTDFKYFPYRFGHALWSFITGTWGDDKIAELFRASAKYGIDVATVAVLNVTTDSLSKMWKNELVKTYQPLIESKTKPNDIGTKILSPEKGAGKNNISPSISPDGKYVIYNSEKNIFTFDLFLADAKTGKTIRKLASTSSDSHLNAISFIESAGAWSSDSRMFAFVVFSKGANLIHIVDPFTGKIIRKINPKNIGAISNPKWDPLSNNIIFSGSNGSNTNLYLYNFSSEAVTQLTNSRHTDLMPAYSPNGKQIAFITDRIENNDNGKFEYGPLRPALLNVDDGSIVLLPYYKYSKHINPLFAPDGKSLYYISDKNGFSNIYRVDLITKQNFQITDIATGISGISQYSPALSIADDGTLLFSVFEKGNYIVYSLNSRIDKGELVKPESYTSSPGFLPPIIRRGQNIVENYLQDFEPENIPKDSLETIPYKPRLTLDFVGSAGVGIGVNQFGAAFGGGVTGVFSDMLNNHLLFTSVQVNGQVKDMGGQLAYINQSIRLNYGASFSHIPYRSIASFLSFDTVTFDGNTIIAPVVSQLVQRIFQDNFTAFTYYPLSMVNRAELSIGYTRLSFQAELIKSFLNGNQIFKEEKEKLPNPEPIHIYNTAVAYVGDNSYYGIVAPLKGYRYRYELGINTGSYNFVSPLIDYRYYLYRKPASFAIRGLEYGRYLGDADNKELNQYYIGNENLIKGYSIGSFSPSECADEDNPEGCPVFDRLFGSKFVVINLEARLPLTGPEEISVITSKYIPLSINAFIDAGVTWTGNSSPELRFVKNSLARVPVVSAGVSLRLGVFGYFAVEVYYAYPFQRPEKGPHLGVFLSQPW